MRCGLFRRFPCARIGRCGMKKRVLESYPFLDIDQLMKYKKNHRVAVSVEFGSQAIRVRLNLESLQGWVDGEEVFLDKSYCGYGGFRYWFLCPACEKRYRILYMKDGLICRKCGKLTYASQQRTKTDCYYFYQKAIKLARTIDPEYEEQRDFFQWPYRFPDRPKNMREPTYWTLKKKFLDYVAEGDAVWLDYVKWRFRR